MKKINVFKGGSSWEQGKNEGETIFAYHVQWAVQLTLWFGISAFVKTYKLFKSAKIWRWQNTDYQKMLGNGYHIKNPKPENQREFGSKVLEDQCVSDN